MWLRPPSFPRISPSDIGWSAGWPPRRGQASSPLAFILVRRRRCFTPKSRWKCPGGRKPLVLHPIIEDSKEHETRVETGVGSGVRLGRWTDEGQVEKEKLGKARALLTPIMFHLRDFNITKHPTNHSLDYSPVSRKSQLGTSHCYTTNFINP